MCYLYQACRAWLKDWFLDRWSDLREFARAQWAKLRTRNTGDKP